jgi:phosphatidylinositol glycan class X
MLSLLKYYIIALASVSTVLLVSATTLSDDIDTEDHGVRSALSPSPTCQLIRTCLRSGFHRDIESNVTVTFAKQLPPEVECEVLLKEYLPTGLFVDLYQTENLHQFGGPKVYSPVDIDVELPEFMSQNHTLHVYNAMTRHATNNLQLQANLSLPIHVRYHRPSSEHDYAQAVLPTPDVFVRCRMSKYWVDLLSHLVVVAEPCSDNTSADCAWIQLTCIGAESLTFEVPVGKLAHKILVVIVTTLVTLTGMAFLIYIMIRHPNTVEEGEKKSL